MNDSLSNADALGAIRCRLILVGTDNCIVLPCGFAVGGCQNNIIMDETSYSERITTAPRPHFKHYSPEFTLFLLFFLIHSTECNDETGH